MTITYSTEPSNFSQSRANSKAQLKEYILCKLGCPVVQINVTDGQMDCAIDDAIDFFTEYHYDGMERCWIAHIITADDMANESFPMQDDITAVSRVMPLKGITLASNDGDSVFDIEYHLRASITGSVIESNSLGQYDLANMYIVQQYLAQIDDLMFPELRHRFSRTTQKVQIDFSWKRELHEGAILLLECFRALDPDVWTKMYGHWVLRDLATAYVKRQWGWNLIKFTGLQMPGGLEFNGSAILESAEADIERIKEKFVLRYMEPDDFMYG